MAQSDEEIVAVFLPVMPIGVEHIPELDDTEAPSSVLTCDADRR